MEGLSGPSADGASSGASTEDLTGLEDGTEVGCGMVVRMRMMGEECGVKRRGRGGMSEDLADTRSRSWSKVLYSCSDILE